MCGTLSCSRCGGCYNGGMSESQSQAALIAQLRQELDATRRCALRPFARQLAKLDPDKRDAIELLDLMMSKATWRDGRAVFDQELSRLLPCPYELEER